jgi:hypothetical protein
MSQISLFLRRYDGGYMHWCPACESFHMIAVEEPLENGARWTFDGKLDAPTFSPSVNIAFTGLDRATKQVVPKGRCHYFLRAGQLQFCGDCSHALAGQTVPLPEIPKPYQD